MGEKLTKADMEKSFVHTRPAPSTDPPTSRKVGKVITQPTYFRLPDLMTIASEEGEHAIDGPSEFTVVMTGIILDYDEIVMCKCNYPNRGEDTICVACEKSLKGLERMRFWRLVPNMQDVDLKVEPLDVGPDTPVYELPPELDES